MTDCGGCRLRLQALVNLSTSLLIFRVLLSRIAVAHEGAGRLVASSSPQDGTSKNYLTDHIIISYLQRIRYLHVYVVNVYFQVFSSFFPLPGGMNEEPKQRKGGASRGCARRSATRSRNRARGSGHDTATIRWQGDGRAETGGCMKYCPKEVGPAPSPLRQWQEIQAVSVNQQHSH